MANYTNNLDYTGSTSGKKKLRVLDGYYNQARVTLLQYQSHTLGLFPRGHTQHARVRDNVYCSMALWALAKAYNGVGWDHGRSYELERSAVKCMRGILFCYMRQSDKLEQFKENRTVKNALHSRYNYITGDPVIDDSDWGHLQIDGTSLFLLVLAQMIASGVQLIFSKDEVDFVQNLVYYIERAYRTPDYGMWEHPTYRKTSTQELHASSIGMAKSALDAIHGLNLFGEGGSPLYTVHVDPDAQYRNHVILDTLLPKESSSRETDSALLCITGFPAFGVKDESLLKETEDKVKNILEGSYGFRRFPKDPTYIGTESMTHIPVDFKVAEGNECQWPLMYIFKCITAMFRNDKETADDYWTKLKQVRRKNKEGYVVIPKFYRCSTTDGDDVFDSGKESKKMEPFIQDTPFLWCQAMYLIWSLLREGLVTVNDLDPLGVHLHNPLNHVASKPSLRFLSVYDDSVIQIALISESSKLQTILTTYGIPTQTVKQIEPITLNAPGELLLKVYSYLGKNEKLGLSGRPMRPVGAIGSSKVYQVFGHLNVFYPADLNMTDFYMSYDIKLFIDTVQSIIRFLNSYWNNRGRPTVTILLQQNLFQGGYFKDMISFLAQLKNGDVCGIRVRLDRLQALISMSCVDILECVSVEEEMAIKSSLTSRSGRLRSVSSSNSLSHSASSLSIAVDDVFNDDTLQSTSSVTTFSDEKPDYGPSTLANYDIEYLVHLFNNETNLVGKLYLLHEIINKTNSDFLIDHVTAVEHLKDVYNISTSRKHWMAVRLGASFLHKVVDCLAPSLTHMLVKEKEVSFGVFGFTEHIVTEPLTPKEISNIIYERCTPYEPIEAALQQELVIYLGDMITRSDMSEVFDGMVCLRLGWIIQAMKNELERRGTKMHLYQMPPFEIKQLLQATLWQDSTRSALYQRQLNGALNRVPGNFYVKVYGILKKTPGGISLRGKSLPQCPTIQLMSGHQRSFSKEVETLLSGINRPEYRQLVVELLMVVSTILERNEELVHQRTIDLDKLLNDAFEMLNEDIKHNVVRIDNHQQDPPFYMLPASGPHSTTTYMAKAAINQLLQDGVEYDTVKICSIS